MDNIVGVPLQQSSLPTFFDGELFSRHGQTAVARLNCGWSLESTLSFVAAG